MEDQYLDSRLEAYAESDYYPFHMPGHKRAFLDFQNPYKMDITEIEGFDNLHHPEEILLKSQERLRNLYKSRKAYYLINGSTCGLLSAVGALTKQNDAVIIARNCHKSVYNAVKIFRLKVHYVYPEVLTCGIQGGIDPAALEASLKKHENVKLVVITSPTYDGIVSDIRKIAEITHKFHAHLIIDEAHGAHFSLSSHFPESSVRLGADIVIQSLHKTLPSFTQTAALHIAGELSDSRKVEEMLQIFQSSSPSYILMAGIEKCVRIIETSGEQLFESYYHNLINFYEKCRKLKHLHILTMDDYASDGHVFDVDSSKILICTDHASISGQALYQMLLKEDHLQMELYSAQYVLAMTSIMDTREGFGRLLEALMKADRQIHESETCSRQDQDGIADPKLFIKEAYASREKILEIWEMDDYSIEETLLEKCSGNICGEYIYLYPPGIPMIVPGERITEAFCKILGRCRQLKLNVLGTADPGYEKILTVAYPPVNKL